MNTRAYQKSFAGGEIASEMFGRIDDVKYQNGAAKLRNFVAKPQGAAKFRPGFEYRASTSRAGDTRTTKSRIIPFSFSLTQSVVLELRGWDGVEASGKYGTIRVHTDSGLLQHLAATPYIGPITVTFSNQSGSIRVSSASWTGTPPSTPPYTEGQRVTFRNTGGALPTSITANKIYYVRYSTNPTLGFLLSETPTGSFVPWTTAGTGTHSIDTVYSVGDVVIVGSQSFMALREVLNSVTVGSPTNTSSSSYWFEQFTSALELRHTYTEAELFELTYTQSFDVITLAHPNHPVREIRRYGTQAWGVIDSSFNTLETVSGLTAAVTYGQAWRWDWAGGLRTSANRSLQDLTCIGRSEPVFSAGELVFCHSPWFQPTHQKFFLVSNPTSYNGNELTNTGYNFDGTDEYNIQLRKTETDNPVFAQFRMDVATSGTYYATIQSLSFSPEDWDVRDYLRTGTPIRFHYDVATVSGGGTTWISQTEICYLQFQNWPTSPACRLYRLSGGSMTLISAPAGAQSGLRFAMAVNGGNTVGSANFQGNSNDYPDNLGLLQPVSSIQDATSTYKVTAVFGTTEGPASSELVVYNNLLAVGSKNTLTWTAVSGATSYNVYKEGSGLFGYVGRSDEPQFVDDNITPDFSKTPPYVESVFGSSGLRPGAVAYFDQRKCFAGSINEPNRLYMSRSFTENDFSYSLPTNDTDRIKIDVAAREANRIRHIVPLGELLLLTNATEWRISPVNSEALTPSTISARPQSYIGANSVQPVIVNNSAIFCAARGGHVREMGFNFQAQGFVTGDLSLRAPHLFDDYELVDMAYQKAPVPVLWTVSTSGKLLGLTYVPEEQVGAWHQHDTDGEFESVAVIPSGEEDRVWVVVKRTINGSVVRYVERMAPMQLGDIEDGIYSDSAKVVTLAPAGTAVTGLSHLEGKTVCVLADGVVQTKKTVSGGAISLDSAATKVIVGLPITGELQTLPIAMQIDGMAQGRVKAINKAWIKLYRSVGLNVGPSGSLTVPAYPYDATGGEKTEEIDVTLLPAWQRYGQVLLKHSEPVPLSVLGMTYEVAVGG